MPPQHDQQRQVRKEIEVHQLVQRLQRHHDGVARPLHTVQARVLAVHQARVSGRVVFQWQLELQFLLQLRLLFVLENRIVLRVHVRDAADRCVAHDDPHLVVEDETDADVRDLDEELDGQLHEADAEGHECLLEVGWVRVEVAEELERLADGGLREDMKDDSDQVYADQLCRIVRESKAISAEIGEDDKDKRALNDE